MTKNRSKTIRAAQVKLLRAEQTILAAARDYRAKGSASAAPLAGIGALFAAAGAAAADALGREEPARFGAELAAKAAEAAGSGAAESLAALAAMTTKYHAAVETMAAEAGLRLIPAAHGQPKDAFLQAVGKYLGIS